MDHEEMGCCPPECAVTCPPAVLARMRPEILRALGQGQTVALVSDAGTWASHADPKSLGQAVADGDLIRRVRYSGEELTPAEAIARYRAELMEERGTDILPTPFMLPVSVAVAKVAADFRLLMHESCPEGPDGIYHRVIAGEAISLETVRRRKGPGSSGPLQPAGRLAEG